MKQTIVNSQAVLACITLAAVGSDLAAQVPDASRGSEAGRGEITVVVSAAVSRLASQIAAAAFEPDASPWVITVPDSTSADWRRARDGLAAALRARSVRASDRLYSSLTLGSIEVRGDSLVAVLTIETVDRCLSGPPATHPFSGKDTATGNNIRVVASRVNGYWQAPVLIPMDTWDGGCIQKVPADSAI